MREMAMRAKDPTAPDLPKTRTAAVYGRGIKLPQVSTVSPYLGWPTPFPPGPYQV